MSRGSPRPSRSEAALRQGIQPVQMWEAQYPDTWLLLEITEEDEGEPLCGRLLATASDPDEIQEVWQASRAQGLLTMLTYGPPQEPRPEVVVSAT
jgi:hypothetical protein